MAQRVFLVAEIGVNHNGSEALAAQLIDAAAAAGAGGVKFQAFRAAGLVVEQAPMAAYQQRNTGTAVSQRQMLAGLELGEEAFARLMARAAGHGLAFLVSPFDLESVDLLDRLGVAILKVPSGEIVNIPYLRAIGRLGRRVFLSTGMSRLGEIEAALEILAEAGTPAADVVVLHCTTEYPAPFEQANLRAMSAMAAAFPGVAVGFSDHTTGIEAALAAVALGAAVVEKHFTLDKALPGPDHRASLDPAEFAALVAAARNVEKALGDGWKRPTLAERRNLPVVRKVLVAARPIAAGERYSAENLTAKRAGVPGVSPALWDLALTRTAPRSYVPDEAIEL